MGLQERFQDPSRTLKNDSIHLEITCKPLRPSKLARLFHNGNGPEVPIGKYPECTGTSTLDIQEYVHKRISELCDKQAEGIQFRAGYADPKRVSADDTEYDLTEMPLGLRCRPAAEEPSANPMLNGHSH